MQTHQVDTQNSHNSMLSVVGKRQSELMWKMKNWRK
jgi:hypothetical protein